MKLCFKTKKFQVQGMFVTSVHNPGFCTGRQSMQLTARKQAMSTSSHEVHDWPGSDEYGSLHLDDEDYTSTTKSRLIKHNFFQNDVQSVDFPVQTSDTAGSTNTERGRNKSITILFNTFQNTAIMNIHHFIKQQNIITFLCSIRSSLASVATWDLLMTSV